MRVLFCSDPLNVRLPDAAFADEASAVECIGVEHALIQFERLLEGDGAGAVRRVPPSDGERSAFCSAIRARWQG